MKPRICHGVAGRHCGRALPPDALPDALCSACLDAIAARADSDPCEPWEWRPPVAHPDAHHTVPIIVDGRTRYQRPPPSAPGGLARDPRGMRLPRAARAIEERADLAPALDVLTPQQRACVSLRLDGHSVAAIAAALKIAPSTVRVHLALAVRRRRSAP